MCEIRRGQAEPNVALMAVSFMVIAVTMFAGYHANVIDSGSDRAIERPVLDRMHDHITEDGRFETSTTLADTLDPSDLPRGQSVHVRIAYITLGGEKQTLDQAYFDGDGNHLGTHPEIGPPPTARDNSRPLVVKRADGYTHGARLYITLWD